MGLNLIFDVVLDFLEELFALIFSFVLNLNSINGGGDDDDDA